MGAADGRYDVVILGGGLAGLTLALQLKLARPETTVAVAEKRPGPAPEAAFKVGESTVEPAAHYFRDVLAMGKHIRRDQLRKAGLRFFFPAGDNTDIAERVEFGSPFWPPYPTYQLDRGRFENELANRCRSAGVDLLPGAFVDDFELGEDGHTATIVRGGPGGDRSQLEGRWLVDASGRADLVKSKLGLAKDVGHKTNASWFRLAGGVAIDEWSDDAAWLARVELPGLRRFSTNHLMGEGYWVWLIQLSSGPISIGIVCDPLFHPFEQISTLDGSLEWINAHEPQLGAILQDRRDDVEDFLKLEHYSRGCERVFSPQRWALTGEAGAFSDPLYSPGSDFIAYSNRLITELVVRDLNDEAIEDRAERYNHLYLRLFEIALMYYENQFGLYGNPQIMVTKIVWDHSTYWGFYSQIFVHDRLADLDFMDAIEPDIQRFERLMSRVQGFLREWHALGVEDWRNLTISPQDPEFLREIFLDLATPYDSDALKAKIRENVDICEAIAVLYFDKAASLLPDAPARNDREINPYGISLQPERWEADGLFEPPGLTVAKAESLAPGLRKAFLDERAATPA